MICYHCGETVPNESSHCYYCGAALKTSIDNDYEDSIEDLIGPAPPNRGYDYLDEYEKPRSRALPIALSIVAAVLLIMVGIYMMSQSAKRRERDAMLAEITIPTNTDEQVPLVVYQTDPTDPTDTTAETTEPEVQIFNPPTLPESTIPQETPPLVQITSPGNAANPTTNVTAPQTTVAPQTPPATVPNPGSGKQYTVVSGDTWYGIAEKQYGQGSMALANMIAQANGKTSTDRLSIGQVLTIPPKPATPTPPPVPRVTVQHVVVSGDTLWTISQKYYGEGSNTLTAKIASANNKGANAQLKIGEVLTIPDVPQNRAPGGNSVPEPAGPATPTAGAGSQTHVVAQNDTYFKIAEKYYGTANFALAEKIAAANNRTTSTPLKLGETIIIPPR